jgi:Flp pilus assembly protein TadB
MRIIRAVRRGQVLTSREEAQDAFKLAIEERRGLPRVRLGYLVVGALSAVGVVVGVVGPSAFLPPSVALLIFIVLAFAFYLPKLDRNLARAARLNRKAAEGGDPPG